ncbi:MAG TPA: Ppx/GppA family phosphatase, partial [Beijerinckiaceae bacterium]|nr:Ppx/GppA family phosphatase [Beijerinckiaceae bacterium]
MSPAELIGVASAPCADGRGRSNTRVCGTGRIVATPPSTYAALDLGTNNCRLLVARPAQQGFRIVDAFSRIVRLGEGMTQSGRLSEAAMQRTLGALEVCREKMDARNVTRARLIATEACRMASNGAEFVGRVRASTGIELEIVDRETEAHLAAG